MHVILQTGLEGNRMREQEFQAEKRYYFSMSIAKSMHQKGLIDEEVLAAIDEKLMERYCPVSAMLLAGKPFTESGCSFSRGGDMP